MSSPFYIASIVDGSISQYIEQVGRNAAAELSTEACLQLLAHIFAIHVAHLTTGQCPFCGYFQMRTMHCTAQMCGCWLRVVVMNIIGSLVSGEICDEGLRGQMV